MSLRGCNRCEAGWRHPVGNCVVCGCGPSPAAVNFWGEPLPSTHYEKSVVVWKLFNGVFPPTLDGKDYPTYRELSEFNPLDHTRAEVA